MDSRVTEVYHAEFLFSDDSLIEWKKGTGIKAWWVTKYKNGIARSAHTFEKPSLKAAKGLKKHG